MSATGLEVFDKTLHVTNAWLRDIMEEIGPDRQIAWKVLTVVLHKLRDRLPIEVAAHLGAQLPLLVRGAYYDQFRPDDLPADWHSMDELVDDVADWLSDTRPVNPNVAVRAVFRVLSEHVPEGQIRKVRRTLPRSVRRAWEDLEDTWDLEAPSPSRTRTAYSRERVSWDH